MSRSSLSRFPQRCRAAEAHFRAKQVCLTHKKCTEFIWLLQTPAKAMKGIGRILRRFELRAGLNGCWERCNESPRKAAVTCRFWTLAFAGSPAGN
jgi:hypothetical protein